MENSKCKADVYSKEDEGRNFPIEAGEGCIKSFLKMEESLNDLFSGIMGKKSQLHCDMEKLQADFIKLIETTNTLTVDLRSKIKDQEHSLVQYKAENSKLKSEIDELKEKIRRSEFHVGELTKELEEFQQAENARCSSPISNSWTNVTYNKEIQVELEASQGVLGNKNKEVAGAREELTMANHKEIELVTNWHNFDWLDTNTTLKRESAIDELTIADIMLITLREAYRFSNDIMDMQLKKLSMNFKFPYSAAVSDDALKLPFNITQKLKELMSLYEPLDINRIFKEKLMKIIDAEVFKYLNEHSKFNLYINTCLHLCRQLILNPKCLSLDFPIPGLSFDKESFNIMTNSEQGVENRVIFPALILYKGNKSYTLRKGLISCKTID